MGSKVYGGGGMSIGWEAGKISSASGGREDDE